MSNQLENISNQYEKFKKEQRISHTSFNQFLSYFDSQDRLSRTLLNGVGVACGFEVTPLYGRVLNTSKIVGVKINQGAGVTTDGTLMTLNNIIKQPKGVLRSDLKDIAIDNKVYTHYKVYDNTKSKYGHFYNGTAQIKLWELVTEAEKTSEHLPIQQLEGIDQLNVMLYVEQYEKELKPCIGIDCDSHGLEVITNLKVVLTDDVGLTEILKKDSLFTTYDTAKLVRELPLLRLKRPVLDASTNTWKLIRAKYEQIIKEKDGNNKDILDHLIEASNKVFSYFKETSELTRTKVEFWYPKFLEEINLHAGFQHIYNYINDLLETYEELRSLLVDIQTVCSPDIKAFPKHLMLGKVKPNEIDTRHQFYHNEVLDHEAKVERAKLLLKRFNEQVKQFNIPYYIPSATADGNDWKSAVPQGVRISPSLHYATLGEKVIPFYYKKSDDLVYAWNFEATRSRTKNQPLGYHYNHGDPNSRVIALLTGIVYNHNDKDFYKIEGQLHHSQRFTTVLSGIKNNIKQFNLDFDVVGVSLTDIKDNKDKDRVSYSEYIKKHPGITHMSGVPAGGTLVLVYESETSEQIIGDFALPYRCCTEKENTSLSIGVSTLCNTESPRPINFEPIGAKIEAFANGTKIEPFKTIGTQLYFDPSLVTGEALNKEITFKVNDTLVETKITVNPTPSINVQPLLGATDIVVDHANRIAYVKFKITANTGTSLSDIDSYAWDFGDDAKSNQTPTDGIVTYGYNLIDLQRRSVTPSLTIKSKGGCSSSYKMSEISIKTLLSSLDCKKEMIIKAVSANAPYSFVIDFGSTTGIAGFKSTLESTSTLGVKTVRIDYNGQVIERRITNHTENISFNKDAVAGYALVTLTSSNSVKDWKINSICATGQVSEVITIESNPCSTDAGTKTKVYVKTVDGRAKALPLQNGDTFYSDNLLQNKVVSNGTDLFKVPVVTTFRTEEQVFTYNSEGVVTLSRCGSSGAHITSLVNTTVTCTNGGIAKTFSVKGTASEKVKYKVRIDNLQNIAAGAEVKLTIGTSTVSIPFGTVTKEYTGEMTLDATSGTTAVKIETCLSYCETTSNTLSSQSATTTFELTDSKVLEISKRQMSYVATNICRYIDPRK